MGHSRTAIIPVTLSDIRAEARRIENATNYEHAGRTPTKRLAALLVALVDHIEQQPAQTIGTLNEALAAALNDTDYSRPHWSAGVETR